MSNLRQAAQDALRLLEFIERHAEINRLGISEYTLSALRQALAEHDRLAGIEMLEKQAGIHVSQQDEPEQEPVAWMYPHQLQEVREYGRGGIGVRAYSGPSSPNLIPVYAAPASSKPPQGVDA